MTLPRSTGWLALIALHAFVRDTARATIGGAELMVDYGRPLQRGPNTGEGRDPHDALGDLPLDGTDPGAVTGCNLHAP